MGSTGTFGNKYGDEKGIYNENPTQQTYKQKQWLDPNQLSKRNSKGISKGKKFSLFGGI